MRWNQYSESFKKQCRTVLSFGRLVVLYMRHLQELEQLYSLRYFTSDVENEPSALVVPHSHRSVLTGGGRRIYSIQTSTVAPPPPDLPEQRILAADDSPSTNIPTITTFSCASQPQSDWPS